VAKMSVTPPYLLNALLRMLGFLAAHVSGRRMVPPACVEFLQQEQLGRLWALVLPGYSRRREDVRTV
jgi:hypothetical protein